MGSFPTSFFAFPLNLILLLGWILCCAMLYIRYSKSLAVRWMMSPMATVLSITFFVIFCLCIGFTGDRTLAMSWVSFLLMLFLQTVLLFVIMRGWCIRHADGRRKVRWRFILLHVGMLIALGASFWGAPDKQTLRMKVFEGVPVREAYHMDGRQIWLPYEIVMKRAGSDGSTVSSVTLEIGGTTVETAVNKPYSKTISEDIYLVGYHCNANDDTKYCILEIAKDPWKILKYVGIYMLLAGALLLFLNGPTRSK